MKATVWFEVWVRVIDLVAFVRTPGPTLPGLAMKVRERLREEMTERHGEAIATHAVDYYERLRSDVRGLSEGGR